MTVSHAYAYRVPLNPFDPRHDEWSTLIREEPVRVGDHIAVSSTESKEATLDRPRQYITRDAPHDWEVVAIERTGNEGTSAAVRGYRGPTPIWYGTLVLRPVRGHS